jgi:hypothetical protein
MLAQLIKSTFKAKAIKVPDGWDKSLEDKFNTKINEFQPSVPNPTNLFASPSTNKIAADASNTISEKFDQFIDDISSAVCQSWAAWHGAAKFVGVLINAGIGVLSPGGLVGAGQMSGPMILAKAKGTTAEYMKHAKAIAFAIGQSWTVWETGYTHSSIPFPGGMVCSTTMPPSPNIPLPIASGASPGEAMLQSAALKSSMLAQFGPPGQHTEALFDAVAQGFSQVFQTWKASSMISNIIGVGGVCPPPPSPPGPVAGAIGNGGQVA